MRHKFKKNCIFCDIIQRDAPAKIRWEWDSAMAFEPLNPVTRGHLLVVPKTHVADFTEDPEVSAITMRAAVQYAGYYINDLNLITSKGSAATQTIFHLHIHLVPRTYRDGLKLPWSE